MGLFYTTSLRIKGKKKEFEKILKGIIKKYDRGSEFYFDSPIVSFTLDNISKKLVDGFNLYEEKNLEGVLSELKDDKEYFLDFYSERLCGGYDIENFKFFETIADISQNVTFYGGINGGELTIDDCIEANFDGKILHINAFLYYEDMQYIYNKEFEKQLPYEKFCDLFKVNKKKFTKSDYEDSLNELQYMPAGCFTYDDFKDMCEDSDISKDDYYTALESIDIEDQNTFFESNKEYWYEIEYNPLTKEYKEKVLDDKINNINDIDEKTYNGLLSKIGCCVKYMDKIPEWLKNEKKFILDAIEVNAYAFDYASDKLKNDKEVIKETIKK